MSPISIKEDQNVEGLRFSSLLPSPLKLLLSLLPVLLLCTGTHAQWDPEDGHHAVARPMTHFDMVPDHEGGAWVAWEGGFGTGENGVVRVRRILADGTRMFPDPGLKLTPDSVGQDMHHLVGIANSVDNDVIVVFSNPTIEPDSGWSIFAQRFNPEGERVFGPTGVPVSVRTGNQRPHLHPSQKRQWVYPDSAGGVWIGYRSQYDDTLRIAGVHADGSPWFESDLNAGHIGNHVYGYADGYAICPADGGGLWVSHASTQTGFMEYYRFDEEGDLVQFVPSIQYITPVGAHAIDLLPDGHGGVFSNSYNDGSPVAVRVDSSGDLPWPDNPFLLGNRASRPVRTSDGGIMWARNYHSDECVVVRLTLDGSSYYEETTYTIYVSNNWQFSSGGKRHHLLTDGNGGWYCMYVISRDSTRTGYNGYLVWRINDDGSLLWPEDTQLVVAKYPALNPSMLLGTLAVPTSDNGVIIGVRLWRSGWELNLFKVLPDASIAGVVNRVDEYGSRIPYNLDLQAFPNPFNASVQIAFQIELSGTYSMQIYDLLGRMVHEKESIYLQGDYRITWKPQSGLASGLYWVVIRSRRFGYSLPMKIVYMK
ncbi:T9SS type A sorting domain-containing protein [bacterium]|nr:T9SS type A sorting domain-containing protein [bacterium]